VSLVVQQLAYSIFLAASPAQQQQQQPARLPDSQAACASAAQGKAAAARHTAPFSAPASSVARLTFSPLGGPTPS